MKRIKTLILSILFSVCTLLTTAGGSMPAVIADGETLSKYKAINGFECIQDVMDCVYLNQFGRAEFNTDEDFITEGEGSVKLTVYGSFFAGTAVPTMNIRLNGNGVLDLSRLKNIQFDIFNQTGEKSFVEVALTIGKVTSNYQKVQLETGKNSIELPYNVKGMAGGFDMSQGKAISIKFPRASSKATAENNVFYLDNVGIGMTLKAPTPYEMEFDDGEFCSFEKNYQEYMTKVGGISTGDDFPILSVNYDRAYSMNKQGRSLKVVIPTQTSPGGTPYFSLADEIWHSFDWEALGAENKYFVFDMYPDMQKKFTLRIYIWRSVSDLPSNRYHVDLTAEPATWNTFRIPIKDWVTPADDGYVMMGKDVAAGTYNYGAPMFLTSKTTGDPITLYFDNFRIESALS